MYSPFADKYGGVLLPQITSLRVAPNLAIRNMFPFFSTPAETAQYQRVEKAANKTLHGGLATASLDRVA